MSDERFAADAEWVMRDLQAAKRLLESFPAKSGGSNETVDR
jgi:hypothetical protein